MPTWLSLLLLDIKIAVNGLEINDFAAPLGIGMWIVLMLVPLTNIDRRDLCCGLAYILYSATAGIALIMVLPKHFGLPMAADSQFMVIFTIVLITILRWTIQDDGRNRKQAKAAEAEKG